MFNLGLLQCRISRLDPRVGKIPWRRKWQPTPVFLPGKSHRQQPTRLPHPWDSPSLPCGSYVSLGCIPDYAAQSFSYSSSTPLFSILLHSRSKQVAYILLFYLKPTHQGLHQVVLSGKELLCQGRRCKKHRLFSPPRPESVPGPTQGEG